MTPLAPKDILLKKVTIVNMSSMLRTRDLAGPYYIWQHLGSTSPPVFVMPINH